jgi:hypothetical protein
VTADEPGRRRESGRHAGTGAASTGGTRKLELPGARGRVKIDLTVVVVLALAAGLGVLLYLTRGDGGGSGGGEEAASPQAPPSAQVEQARNEAVDVATDLLDTWSRPDVAYPAWWADLEPLLTPGGREAYAFTDPAQVPALEDLEPDRVVVSPTNTTATVYFTSAEGEYGVDLSRSAVDEPWLANRVVFPGKESMF